ncbi:BTB/POZ domain-containing protein 9 [Drosophila persimilis]|uniref:BTB/POZ domain-containing protein 9 n=1 Tax=Drosophila persimilis TaxID=7234 RepID=UPI000F0948CC|nr:BTB/POZ domain-containing protein 9 [Drosophila persimilis]XP_026847862.1 BTB/POZ domain-containing protein 9 [Drosophila persimilis]
MSTEENNALGFVSDMSRLCMNELYSDVIFLVEDQRLPGHRNILAARSEYFRALLYGDMAESKEREIRLEVTSESFKIILEYLYSGNLPISTLNVDQIVDVLDLSHLYGLKYVETVIAIYLQNNLSLSNVCVILDAARRCYLNDLTKECLKYMDRNVVALLKQESFQLLSKESLEEVLRRDSFCAPEVEIFRSVCKWKENNPSEDIKTMLSLVRLPLMSIDDLLHVVRPSHIFESDKIFHAIDQLNTGENLPYRIIVLPGENVASHKYNVGHNTDNQNEKLFVLSNFFVINSIEITACSLKDFSCHVEVSCDRTHWDRVGTVGIKSTSFGPQIRFTERTVRYIRIVKAQTYSNTNLSAMYLDVN